MPVLAAQFLSAYPEIAAALFIQAFEKEISHHNIMASRLGGVNFIFRDDLQVRDVRSWLSDALGCGLITSCSVTVA